MDAKLAEMLLGKVMNWDEINFAKERFCIQMLAEVKYDEYEQYTHGMKFIESLALWLSQFDQNDRKTIYDFISDNLIFISAVQMRQLIDMAFLFYVKPVLIEHAKAICLKENIVLIDEKKKIYERMLRKTLFLGLSDGAHIDFFRRANAFLSNEQVIVYYDFSESKVEDLKKELASDMTQHGQEQNPDNSRFDLFCLLDDFSASGISYIRKEDETWKGKICKFVKQMIEYKLNTQDAYVHVVIYLATTEAINYINAQLQLYSQELDTPLPIKATAIQYIKSVTPDTEVVQLLEKYYRHFNMQAIEDKHYKKGKCDHPFLGFNECSLPLVLSHNTPNNSLPLIWYNNNEEFQGLFPRVMRHKGAG